MDKEDRLSSLVFTLRLQGTGGKYGDLEDMASDTGRQFREWPEKAPGQWPGA